MPSDLSFNPRQINLNTGRGRIEIKFPYQVRLLPYVRSLPDRMYDPQSRLWHLPATPFHARRAIEVMRPHDFLPSAGVVTLAEGPKTQSRAAEIKRFFPLLKPYQVEAVDFLLKSNGRAILADDIGLGKTPMTLAYLKLAKVRRRIMVVCPASMTYQWQDEFQKWLGWKSLILIGGKATIPAEDGVVILSYAVARMRVDECKAWEPVVVIADEAHYLKDRTTKQSKAVVAISRKAQHVLPLSGTPFKNRVAELWSMLNLVDKDAWPEYYQFVRRYCDGWSQSPIITNEPELIERLKDIMIRRTKEQLGDQLPKINRIKIRLSFSGNELSEYWEASRDLINWLDDNGRDISGALYAEALVRISVLRQLMGKAKAPIAIDWADDFLRQSDRKLIIFAVHKEVVALISEALKKWGVVTITGTVKQAQRADAKRSFQEGQERVILISTAGGEGINLFAASDVLFAERCWTPADEEQIEGRSHRTGQQRNVTSWYLVGPDIDEWMDELIEAKRTIFRRIVGASDVRTSINELIQSFGKRRAGKTLS